MIQKPARAFSILKRTYTLRTPPILPPAFATQMQLLLGTDLESFNKSLTENAPVSIRFNPAKKKIDHSLDAVPWCDTGKYLRERPVFTLDPLFHAGAYYVQEASSMFLEQAFKQSVDLTQSLNVLDLCAAPGGKSTHLLSLLNNASLLVSNEVIRSRASVLAENIQKWGHSNVIVTNNDPDHFKKLRGFFDVIIVDAPCSGEGLFRKEPEAMNEWSPESVDLCCKRQRRILSDIWPALKTGGILIYSTCTYNRLENEENLRWLNNEHDAKILSLTTDPSWGIQETQEGTVKGYHFYPHRTKGEGLFIAVAQKMSEQETVHIKAKNKFFQRPTSKVCDQLKTWVQAPDDKTFLLWKDNVLMVPLSKVQEIEYITQNLHIITTGTTVAEIKHDKLIPDQALATSVDINLEAFQHLTLTREQALQYLRKENLQLTGFKRGFSLVVYDDLPLGWANVLDNRINNMYPANWRIRMAG